MLPAIKAHDCLVRVLVFSEDPDSETCDLVVLTSVHDHSSGAELLGRTEISGVSKRLIDPDRKVDWSQAPFIEDIPAAKLQKGPLQ